MSEGQLPILFPSLNHVVDDNSQRRTRNSSPQLAISDRAYELSPYRTMLLGTGPSSNGLKSGPMRYSLEYCGE
ncbi:hypothetical protein TgHK011_007340 [Trichoderma gracile]|nr:hypothetical protein TgHK011_007340 [Trichoderma gracile]